MAVCLVGGGGFEEKEGRGDATEQKMKYLRAHTCNLPYKDHKLKKLHFLTTFLIFLPVIRRPVFIIRRRLSNVFDTLKGVTFN